MYATTAPDKVERRYGMPSAIITVIVFAVLWNKPCFDIFIIWLRSYYIWYDETLNNLLKSLKWDRDHHNELKACHASNHKQNHKYED